MSLMSPSCGSLYLLGLGLFQSSAAQSLLTRFTPDACALLYGCSVGVLQLTLDAF